MDYCGSGFKNWKRLHFYAILCLFCCFCLCIYMDKSYPNSLSEADNHFKNFKRSKNWDMAKDVRGSNIGGVRKLLGGLGSSPPRCTSKCGRCTPCTAVHVPVPPGTPVTTEYYPEAWRCKCGNKLYMP
ncbi:hypothetical protein CDL12_28655 [Handroanthus impetiginosus]|uniref:Epidermal patterning factor-like protein n=1 Tax=Handroanthus impetiginosus TaxID=429701 RepID=A0A2G9G0P4_9LAMI|nr:hypothetical protein CDL12_28655 [Handroanthus impetiginosus]